MFGHTYLNTCKSMNYKIFADLWEALKSSDKSMKDAYAHLEMSSTGFKQSFDRETLTLKNYIKLCQFLELNPSFFFETNHTNLVNEGNLNYATGKRVNQTIGATPSHENKETEILRVENEGLKKENALLREMIEMYKNK